jgi:uncharacterized protein (TIGR00661 family)
MRVLYGVTGEGMGHATRSRVVIEHLRARGHAVKVVASDRAYAMLSRHFPDVVEIRGLRVAYADGAMDLAGSLRVNLAGLPSTVVRNAEVYRQLERFDPRAVVSDFESLSYLFGAARGLPVFSVDNHQVIARCDHRRVLGPADATDFRRVEAFVAAKLPACRHYVVTTFYYPPVRPACAASTTLVAPILRAEVRRAALGAAPGEHVLVYQTAEGDSRLVEVLQRFAPQRFVVYGLRRDAILGNVVCKGFSEAGLVRDLAAARAVVANGGMSLLGEALALGKPVYSVPIRGQFEQGLNARYLAWMGYGARSDVFGAEALAAFLRDAPRMAQRIRDCHAPVGNDAAFAALDGLLRAA